MKITAYLFLGFFIFMLNFMFVPDLISDDDSSLTLLGVAIIIVQVGAGITLLLNHLRSKEQ